MIQQEWTLTSKWAKTASSKRFWTVVHQPQHHQQQHRLLKALQNVHWLVILNRQIQMPNLPVLPKRVTNRRLNAVPKMAILQQKLAKRKVCWNGRFRQVAKKEAYFRVNVIIKPLCLLLLPVLPKTHTHVLKKTDWWKPSKSRNAKNLKSQNVHVETNKNSDIDIKNEFTFYWTDRSFLGQSQCDVCYSKINI